VGRERHRRLDGLVHVEEEHGLVFSPAQVLEIFDDSGNALGALVGEARPLSEHAQGLDRGGGAPLEVRLEDSDLMFEVQEHERERVADLVRDAGGEATDGGHAVGARELRLEANALGDVPDDGGDGGAPFERDTHGGDLAHDRVPVGVDETLFDERYAFSRSVELRHALHDEGAVVRVHGLEHVAAEHGAERVP
jgi:hypothetical protein